MDILNTLDTLVEKGIIFDYCPDAMMPQIPYIDDVLKGIYGQTQNHRYTFCQANHPIYVNNTLLAAYLAANKVLEYAYQSHDDMSSEERKKQAKIAVAKVIIALAPPEARTEYCEAYVQAKKILEK